MQQEQDFIRSLRSVVIHLIKHDRGLYRDLVEMVEACDRGAWSDLPLEDKIHDVAHVQGRMPELEAYYENYPHAWSKERFEDFRTALATFSSALTAQQ